MKPSRFNPQLFALIAVSLLAHVTMSGGRVTASLFVLKHGGSEALAGVTYSLYSLLPVFFSLRIGRWIDQIGLRKVMRISLVGMIAGLCLPVIWPTLPAILIMSALCGLGFAGYMLAANVTVGRMPFESEANRVGMFGWLQMGNSVSSVVGPFVCGLMIDFWGFRAAFALLVAIVVTSLLGFFRLQLPEGLKKSDDAPTVTESIVLTVLRDRKLLRLYLIAMTISLAWDAFVFMTPVLGNARGYSATSIGLVLSAFAAGTFAVRATLPWLSRHFSEWRMLSMTLLLSAFVFLALPLADNSFLHALMGFAFGLAAGAGQPNIINLVYRSMPAGREGEGIGLRSMMGNAMGLVGPSLFGAIASLFGTIPVFLIVGGVMSASSWQARRAYREGVNDKKITETD